MDVEGENRQIAQFAYQQLKSLSETHHDYMMCFTLGDLAQRLSDSESALRHYQRCLELHPNDPWSLGRITEVLSADGKFAQAEQFLSSMPGSNSLALLRSTLRAQVLAHQEKWSDAAAELQQTIHIDGDERVRQQARLLLMRCLTCQKKHVEAAQIGLRLVGEAGTDDARLLLIESLIKANNYSEAIRQIELLKDAGKYATLLDAVARQPDSLDKLTALHSAIDQAERFNRDAPTPALLRARVLFQQRRPDQAIELLADRAAHNPHVAVYWSDLIVLRGRVLPEIPTEVQQQVDNPARDAQRPTQEKSLNAAELIWRCGSLCRIGEITSAKNLLRDELQKSQEQKTHAETVAAVMEAMALENLDVAQQLLELLRSDMATHLSATGGESMEAFSRILLACERTQDLSQLTSHLFVNQTSLHTVHVLRTQVQNGLLDPQQMAEHNRRNAAAAYPTFLVEVLLAEADAAEFSPTAAVERLLRLSPEDARSQVAIAALLHLAGYDKTPRNGLAERGFRLVQQYPHDAEAEFLLSCGLRNSQRFPESVEHARRAFVLNQDPRYLLHAAYTLSLMNNKEASQHTLQLAFDAGLSGRTLSSFDRNLLATLHSVDATTAAAR